MTSPGSSTPSARLERWAACQQRIADCRHCLDRWPSRLEATLGVDEIPNPPPSISILFVGVAAPPIGSDTDDEPGHFYSDPCDRLRLGLFQVVDQVLETRLIQQNRIGLEAGTIAFLNVGFFFIHAAKVRPVRGRLSPDVSTMRFCAQRHFVDEVLLLQPRAICVLGATKAGPAAETVFGRAIGEVPERAAIRARNREKAWNGWAAVTVQPLRGTKEGKGRERVARVIERIRGVLKASDEPPLASTPRPTKSEDA